MLHYNRYCGKTLSCTYAIQRVGIPSDAEGWDKQDDSIDFPSQTY
jgi:hypothetical protein